MGRNLPEGHSRKKEQGVYGHKNIISMLYLNIKKQNFLDQPKGFPF